MILGITDDPQMILPCHWLQIIGPSDHDEPIGWFREALKHLGHALDAEAIHGPAAAVVHAQRAATHIVAWRMSLPPMVIERPWPDSTDDRTLLRGAVVALISADCWYDEMGTASEAVPDLLKAESALRLLWERHQ